MAYSTAADITLDFQGLTFGSTTLVTSAAVDGFIAEADALINSYVGQRYSTPITAGADALALMKLMSRTLVSDRVRKIKEVKTASPGNTVANQSVRGYTTLDVMKQLQAIANNEIALIGATDLVSHGGIFSNNDVNSICPTFHKDRQEW